MLGWNWRAPIIIRELDNYLQPGSIIKVVADVRMSEFEGEDFDLINLELELTTGVTTDRRILEKMNIENYDHIIILCYTDHLNAHEADSATLMTLLQIRDITENLNCCNSLVSEMKDIRNRNLAEVTGADDYIVSDQMLSLLLTQISENRDLSGIFWDLFDPDGSEIYLKPVQRYVHTDRAVNFYTVADRAADLGEIAIGYRIFDLKDDANKAYGVVVNPDRSGQVSFGDKDTVIVLAED